MKNLRTKFKIYVQDETGSENITQLVGEIFRALFLVFITILMFCEGHFKLGTLSAGWALMSVCDVWLYYTQILDQFDEIDETLNDK